MGKRILLSLILFSLMFSLFSTSAHALELNGTIYDVNRTRLNNTLVNITLYEMGPGQGPQIFGANSTFSYNSSANGEGWFNLTVSNNTNWFYKPVITHTNSTFNTIDYVGQSLPTLPYSEFSRLSNVNFYLKEAGTINITAINETGVLIPFGYMIKDTKLGYEVSMNTNTSSSGVLVYVPKERNYSIMLWPAQGDNNHFVPVSFNWNNFSATEDYTFGLSNYNHTTRVLSKQFNVTESFAWVSGYINDSYSSIAGWDNFTVVPFVLEPSDMIFTSQGTLPYNASAWRQEVVRTDSYNYSTGFYNITLPYSASETVRYMLFAGGMNTTEYRGSYRNITVTGDRANFNFTMYGMLGSAGIINMSDSIGGSRHIVNTKKHTFSMVNSTSILSSITAHTETRVDYSSYNCMEFTFMEDISSDTGTFSLPLLNETGIKETNVYSSSYAPKRVSTKTVAQLTSNSNISMSTFNPGDIHGTLGSSDITISLYTSNLTCDVPNPPTGCNLTSTANMAAFNPMSAVFGGGKISFRMGYGGILIHYVNVDMLASGPPDGMFDSSASESASSSAFSSAMKFGSQGPTIYDYVLVSIPYTEGNATHTGLNESAELNMSIPYLYEENVSGVIDWNAPIWNISANGTSGSNLGGNYSHFNTHRSEWQTLMGNNTCVNNVSQFNSTNPCYIDNSSNRIWIRLPHFSGNEPDLDGDGIPDSTPPSITAITTSGTSSTTSSGTANISATTNEAATCWYKASSFNASDISGATSMTGSGTSHSFTQGYTSTGTIGPYYISCGDTTGNNMTSSNSTGSISVTVTTTTTSGGGGAALSTEATDVKFKTKTGEVNITALSVKKDGSFTITLERSVELDITELYFGFKNEVKKIWINIEKINAVPALPEGIDGYRYYDIKKENFTDEDLKNATMNFWVSRDWIDKNKVNRTTVSLYRYSGGSWNKLKTTLVNELQTDYLYKAEFAGLSYFAIGGEKREDAKEKKEEEKEKEKEDAGDTEGDEEEKKEEKPSALKDIWIWILVIVLIAAVGAALWYFKYRETGFRYSPGSAQEKIKKSFDGMKEKIKNIFKKK